MGGNRSLIAANKAQENEFYTQLPDIEKELVHYKHHFKDKVVFCNCDDPEYSNFWKYFMLNFEHLKLKKLIATHYHENKKTYKLELLGKKVVDGEEKLNIIKTPLSENGDYRSPECLEMLRNADIVVTNPPFTHLRNFISTLIDHDKHFIIIGNQNAVTYKEVFKLMQNNEIWLGYKSGDMSFRVPDYYEPRKTRYWEDEDGKKWRSLGNICWFTNLDISKRHEKLIPYKKYEDNRDKYPKFDNYDVINVDRVVDIPSDYSGAMGVPITFLNKHNPAQFEILNCNDLKTNPDTPDKPHGLIKDKDGTIDGKPKYVRVVIKRIPDGEE